jgi:hypothetical protein
LRAHGWGASTAFPKWTINCRRIRRYFARSGTQLRLLRGRWGRISGRRRRTCLDHTPWRRSSPGSPHTLAGPVDSASHTRRTRFGFAMMQRRTCCRPCPPIRHRCSKHSRCRRPLPDSLRVRHRSYPRRCPRSHGRLRYHRRSLRLDPRLQRLTGTARPSRSQQLDLRRSHRSHRNRRRRQLPSRNLWTFPEYRKPHSCPPE